MYILVYWLVLAICYLLLVVVIEQISNEDEPY